MKKSIMLLATVGVLMLPQGAAFAMDEEYWYKGANYGSTVTDDYGRWADIGASTVVVSASTIYDGRLSGKERIRAWTRNAEIGGYYGAYVVNTVDVTVAFGSPNGVNSLVTAVAPLPKSSFTSLGLADWWVKGYLKFAYELGKAFANDMIASVTNDIETYRKYGAVTFRGNGLQDVELSPSLTYTQGDSYYNGVYNTSTNSYSKQPESSGVVAYFNFSYGTNAANPYGQLDATARATYDMRIATGGLYPIILGAKTGNATLYHTVSYQP